MSISSAELDAPTRDGKIQANDLGPIAESYDLLHNLPTLAASRQQHMVAPATRNSAIRSIYQCVEIGLLNLTRLTERSAAGLQAGELTQAAEMMRWANGFHLILRRLGESHVAVRMRLADLRPKVEHSLTESEALRHYLAAHVRFEAEVLRVLEKGDEVVWSGSVDNVLGLGRNTDLRYAFLNGIRCSAHESAAWEANLLKFSVDADMPGYRDFVAYDLLKSAVEKSQLHKECCYTEFVALHQIPETLSVEVNDLVEEAVRDIRANRLTSAQERLHVGCALLPAMVEAQRVMVACLSTSDYHTFRDNLGPASGMHSLAVRNHMFKDLYAALWNEIERKLETMSGGDVETFARQIDCERHDIVEKWLMHGLMNSAFTLYGLFDSWRHEHLHMARNCLGTGGTKSMIGVPDGLELVKRMRDVANALPALNRIHRARGQEDLARAPLGPVAARHQAPESLDLALLERTGSVARQRFPHVQQLDVCPFHRTEPPRQP